MKNITCFCAIFVLILCACNETQHYRIGVSQCSDDDWRKKMNQEIYRELMFHPEAEVEILSADDSNEKQISDIQYFIDNRFDIIIAAPNEADALTPIIYEAYNKGIPVVLFDRNIKGESYTAWQGANNVAIGQAAANQAIEVAGKNAGIVEIMGLRGSTPAEERHSGFHSVEGIKVLGEGYGNWNYEDASVVADSLFSLYPDAKVVYAHNDRMAIAASDVARRKGLHPYIIGIDAAPEIGMKAVADSVIDATFLYPTEGQRLIQTAIAILNNEPYERHTELPASAAVEKSNVGILLLQNESIKKETERMELLKAEVDDYWSQHSSQTAFLYAVVAIVLLLSGLLFMLLRTFWQHRRHQAQLEAATASKLAFFTNVSHDLRTPLTLISEPVEQLSNSDNLTPKQKSLMKIADKNVRILMRLINQILDIRKSELGDLKLNLSQTNLATNIKGWADAFEGLARRRDIEYNVNINPDCDIEMAFDIEKLERVFYNLVANAFKYTPDNGKISIDCRCDGSEAILTVSDTGKGISADDLPFIFDQFFQVEKVRPNGSGIGLALAKAFVKLHGGNILVESELGKGTIFTVKLPVKTVNGLDNPIVVPMITSEVVDAELSAIQAVDNGHNAKEDDLERSTVLVIDDNGDIRAMLKALLEDNYTVVLASNGAEGLRLAAKYVPDLVICDVMMPEMDGIECCRRIKNEVSTSHIPVLMLTACAMDEQRIEGFNVGADGYVSKPFSSKVLLARVRNLIDNRKLIKNLWLGSSTIALSSEHVDKKASETKKNVSVHGAPDIDNEFYKKFLELVYAQIGNADLNVEDLASSMGLGRSQFYRKIKSLTNYSPVELLRRIRLTRARDLLTTTEKTISEISYEVGFSTPAYFTKCYREAYGETPSDLRERLTGR